MSGYDDLRDPNDFDQTITLEQYRRNEKARKVVKRRVEVAGYSGAKLA